MDDAEDSAADGEAVPAPGQPYTLLVRLHGGGIGYIALMRKPGLDGRAVYQRCRRLDRMVSILPRRDPDDDSFDWYLGLNAFKCATRRAEHLLSLRGNFVDIDAYKISAWQAATPETIWEAVRQLLVSAAIPIPQVAIFSGRGLQLVWAFHKGLPARALPRWRAVQTELARALEQFGADHGALDVSRVLRLPGTVNQKSCRRAGFVHMDMEGATSFESLARAVLPVDRATIRSRREAKRDRRSISENTSARSDAARAYVDAVLSDMRKLIAHRWQGRIPVGQRNEVVFMYGCLLVRRVGMAALPSALVDFGRATTGLDDWELEQIAGSIASKLTLDGAAIALASPAWYGSSPSRPTSIALQSSSASIPPIRCSLLSVVGYSVNEIGSGRRRHAALQALCPAPSVLDAVNHGSRWESAKLLGIAGTTTETTAETSTSAATGGGPRQLEVLSGKRGLLR